ncbi:MAG: InlB B-repeat-containing protein [Blautia sp.]|nr:InlB B-repeat-containing protein [Blautia sp.]
MKRKLHIILALAAVLAVLVCGKAMADNAFTRQPADGTIPVQGQYKVSWTTNFTQQKVEIVRVYKENTGSYINPDYVTREEVYATLPGTQSSYPFRWKVFRPSTEYWYVRSYYGSGDDQYISSSQFSLTDAEAAFTLQSDKVNIPVQGKAPIRWETNCTVEKVEVVRVYRKIINWFSSDYTLETEVYDTVEAGSNAYYFDWDIFSYTGTEYWYLKGYAKDLHGSTWGFRSVNFEVSCNTARFTASPEGGTIPVQGQYTINWNTNFTADKVKIIRVYRSYDLFSSNYKLESQEYDVLETGERSYTFHWQIPDILTEYWYVSALCSDSKGHSIWEPGGHFTLTNAPAEITTEPVGGEIPVEGTRRVTWGTNFTISKVEIYRAYRYLTNIFSGAYEIRTELYDTVEGNVTYYDFPWGANSYNTEYWYLRVFYPESGGLTNWVHSGHFMLTNETRAFTTEPLSSSIPSSGSRTISWDINFTATGFDLVHADTGEVETSFGKNARSGSVSTPGTYYLRANFESGSVNSSIFILAGGGISCAFTEQPEDGFADRGKTAGISWRLNFTPEMTQVLRGTGSDYSTYTVVDTLGRGILSDSIPTSDETYVLKAFARQSGSGLSCYSQPFSVTAYEDNGFTLQPKSGSQLEGSSYRVTWELSFQPAGLYLYWCNEKGMPTQGAPVVELDASRNWHDVVNRDSFYTYRYMIRAYFNDRKFVDSLPFEVATVQAEKFAWQPQEYSISHLIMLMNEPCEVEWSVNFPPAAAEIQSRAKGSSDAWTKYNQAIMGESLLSATIPFSTSVRNREFRVATTSLDSGKTFYSDTFHITLKCEFTFDANGHGKNPDTQYVDYLGYAVNPGAPGEAGDMSFRGWFREPGCSSQYNFGLLAANQNMTLYAGWAYTVTFDANGQPGAANPPAKYVRPGRTVTAPDYYTAPTSTSLWYVSGWYLEPACINAFDFETPINGNVTLYARWVFDGYTYTYDWSGHVPVTYSLNANSYETGGASSFTYNVAKGKAAPRPYATGVPYPGYDIDGWYTEPEFVNRYDFAALSSGDTTLYARWMPYIHVTTHYIYPDKYWMGGDTYTYGGRISDNEYFMSIFADMNSTYYTNLGWHFTGWYVDEDCTQLCDLTAPLTQDLEVYSGWEKIPYTVVFDRNGGTGMENLTLTMYYGDIITMPAEQPTRDGYIFRGWEGSNDTTFWIWTPAHQETCTGNVTYLASWVPDGIAINTRNFPDANFRSYVSDNFDIYRADGSSGADGYLSNNELETVTAIIYQYTAAEKKISDLTGIRYFTNLEQLTMTFQNFSAADLSWNTRLTKVNFGNTQSLTWLNAGMCRELTELNVNNTALTSLDLCANTALKKVECIGCVSLTSLTLRGNFLKQLSIHDSGLQTVDITGCPILMETVLNGTYSGVTDIFFAYYTHADGVSAGRITVTNSKNNTVFITSGIPIDEAHFPDAGFRRLLGRSYYDRNQNGALTEDEIARITSFTDGVSGMYNLQGIEYLPNLNYIVLNDVGLEQIDLSANPLIDTLVVKRNALTEVDAGMLASLSHLDVACNPGLDTLILPDAPIETLNCYGCPLIHSLDLSGQPHLLKAYMDGDCSEEEYEGVTFMRYGWADEGETLLGFLRIDADIDIALPEWVWQGENDAVFLLPDGTEERADIVSETSADGRFITYTASVSLSGVPFEDSRTFCLVAFEGADVPAQEVKSGERPIRPEDPFTAGSIFEGWYLDAGFETPCAFDEPITEGFTVYARWSTPEVSSFLKLPAALTDIESEAFSGIPAKAVIVPDSVTAIAYDAFRLSGVEYIYGFPGSAAETFADTYDYIFVPIDDAWLSGH